MMWWPDGGGWTGWIFMTITMVAFWGLLVGLMVVLVKGTRARTAADDDPRRPSALAILEERFARGEIDRDELEQRRATLERDPIGTPEPRRP